MAPGSPETSDPCCLRDTPSAGRWRPPQAWLMGQGAAKTGSWASPLWSVSHRSLELCPSQSRLVGRVLENSPRGSLGTPFLPCASVSLREKETKPTGLSDSAVPRSARKEKEAPRVQTPLPARSGFVFEQPLGQPIRTENPGLCLPWLTAPAAGSQPVKPGSWGALGREEITDGRGARCRRLSDWRCSVSEAMLGLMTAWPKWGEGIQSRLSLCSGNGLA